MIDCMGTIRLVLNVPPEVRAALKIEAAREGKDMSELGCEYLSERMAETIKEIRAHRNADKKGGISDRGRN